jgi:hypothetical protein
VGLVCLAAPATIAGSEQPSHRVYSQLLDPREHPDYDRRAVKPPSWETFKNRTQFTCLRGFEVQNDQIVRYAEQIEKFTRTYELGDVIWPSYPILFAKNLHDLAQEIKQRDLYLFDIWGYVPGSGPGGYWQQFQPPAEAFATLETILGERWLGTDIGCVGGHRQDFEGETRALAGSGAAGGSVRKTMGCPCPAPSRHRSYHNRGLGRTGAGRSHPDGRRLREPRRGVLGRSDVVAIGDQNGEIGVGNEEIGFVILDRVSGADRRHSSLRRGGRLVSGFCFHGQGCPRLLLYLVQRRQLD